jgi:hypothetical protein
MEAGPCPLHKKAAGVFTPAAKLKNQFMFDPIRALLIRLATAFYLYQELEPAGRFAAEMWLW